ncbi:hypothetical protein ACFW16_24795 [Inquilinus sp. NPDC058860]|uniref:hypothetical protein n=1 Tax=Inquilinus sp. NPDC058860 TaxID=3346652 RepID=UPI00368D4A3E
MPKPAFIVDGHLEFSILQAICKDSPLRRLNTNGDSVVVSKMAEKAAPVIRLLGNRYYPVYIVSDREDREESCEAMEAQYLSELKLRGIDITQIKIVFCDRMIENWIIADVEMIRGEYGDCVSAGETEGCDGKTKLRQIMSGAQERYSETVHGLRLFKRCNPARIAENSPSFRKLVLALEDRCEWLARHGVFCASLVDRQA